jgi:hypothetical protein
MLDTLLCGGGLYTARAQEDPRATPPREGGGGVVVIEAIGIAFVVHAVEAVGATHGILAVQIVEGVAHRRTGYVFGLGTTSISRGKNGSDAVCACARVGARVRMWVWWRMLYAQFFVLGNMGIPWCCKYEWQFAASGCVGVPRPSATCVSYVGLRLSSVGPTGSPFRERGAAT